MLNNNSLEMTVMTQEQIMKAAPQAYASTPKPGVSQKYTFLPTSRIIEDMDKLGWKVSQAKASRYRNASLAEYGNHVIRFFHPDIYLRNADGGVEAYINVVVMNNHTGRGSFRFEIGIFRLVCSNGLVIKDKDFGSFQLRHSGYSFEQLQGTMQTAIDRLPDLVGRINVLSQRIMTKEEQFEFAQKAFQLRSTPERLLSQEDLQEMLAPRRKEDAGDSLWHVFNRVQEGVMKGGFMAVGSKGKLRKVKGIRNIQKDLQMNQELWEMAMSYA
jgi:hypothetical protein